VENKELAALINSSDARQMDKIKLTPFEIAEQRQRMKKASAGANRGNDCCASSPDKRQEARKAKGQWGEKGLRWEAGRDWCGARPRRAGFQLFGLADDVGGMGALKRLVERLANG
jgi:hypothetical protein